MQRFQQLNSFYKEANINCEVFFVVTIDSMSTPHAVVNKGTAV